MLDPARHFETVAAIKSSVDAMAQNKLNVLHLHLTDGEAFAINTDDFSSFPLLSQKGAYAPSLSYTASDFTKIVDHARLRGVRVIPEVDAPAHMASWAQGYEELLTACPTVSPHPEWPTYYSPGDVTNEKLYDALDEIVGNLAKVFVDELWHVGGDEPQLDCWEANDDIVAYMKAHNMTDSTELYSMFENRYSKIVNKYGKKVVGWREIGTLAKLHPATTLINVWDGNDKLQGFLDDGYSAIVSSNWYLNNGGDWTSYYNDEPMSYALNATDDQKELVLGGQACMWSSGERARNGYRHNGCIANPHPICSAQLSPRTRTWCPQFGQMPWQWQKDCGQQTSARASSRLGQE